MNFFLFFIFLVNSVFLMNLPLCYDRLENPGPFVNYPGSPHLCIGYGPIEVSVNSLLSHCFFSFIFLADILVFFALVTSSWGCSHLLIPINLYNCSFFFSQSSLSACPAWDDLSPKNLIMMSPIVNVFDSVLLVVH